MRWNICFATIILNPLNLPLKKRADKNWKRYPHLKNGASVNTKVTAQHKEMFIFHYSMLYI